MRLSSENINDVRARFFQFFDGVVRSVRIETGLSAQRRTVRTCELRIEAKDREAARGWSMVSFRIEGVSEFRFQHGQTIYEVLSDGMQFVWHDNSLYVLLDANPDDDQQIPDLGRNIAYVVGTTCDMEAVALAE